MNAAPNDAPKRPHAQRTDPTPAPFTLPRRAAGEEGEEGESRFGFPIDPYRVYAVLRTNPRPILAATLVGIAAAVAGLALMPKSYVATSSLQYAAVQNESMTDRPRALTGAIDALDDLAYLTELGKKLHVPAGAVLGRLEIVPEMDLGILRIKARARTASESTETANLAATELLAHLGDLERDAVRAEISDVERRIAGQARELDRVRGTYDAFRRENGIMDLATERTQQIDSAAQLRSQRDLAQAEIEGLEARVAQLRRDLARTPRMVAASSSTTSGDQAQLARLEAELTSARSTYSDDHPAVRSLELQVASTRRRIDSGHGSASTAVTMGANGQYQMLESSLAAAEAELAAARERSSSIDELATTATQRVTAFSAIEGRATELLGEVRTHEALLAELRERRARLDARLRNPNARFAIGSPATRPLAPESATKKRVLAGALPLVFLVVAVAALLVRDLGKGRMRTPSEIAFWSRMPVIATTDWPKNLRSLDDLVADMDDWSQRADGTTMLVPLGDREAPVVTTLAERLDSGWTIQDPSLRTAPISARPSESPASNRPISTIIVTPPPTSTVSRQPSVGLVRSSREPLAIQLFDAHRRRVVAWEGRGNGPKLRRESRLADRVAVVVSSGVVTVRDLATLRTRLGREDGVAIIVVDVPPQYLSLPDRVGPIDTFWNAIRVDA